MDSSFSVFSRFSKYSHDSAFSLVELIVVITIVAILGMVAVTYDNNYKLSEYNVRRVADIKTLKNSMESYILAKKTTPEPTGNIRYYDDRGNYLHDGTGSFGASAFVTPETFPKDYVNYLPMDPQTNHYYAYGRRDDGTIGYEFATVINDGGQYSAYLLGDYDGSKIISLVKEYSGPGFVDNGSVDFLPYDPTEMKITGNITSWSGSVWLDTGKTKPLTNPKQLLGEGDTIVVSTGGLVKFSLSDGSELELGSKTSDSELRFDTLRYSSDNNLSSQVESFLTMGEVWVRAPKYYHESSFSIKTDGQAATVRGTVFGVKKDATTGSASYILAQGKISIDPDEKERHYINLNSTASGFTQSGGSVVMDASASTDPISFTLPRSPSNSDIPGTAGAATPDDKARALEVLHETSLNSGYRVEFLEATKTGSTTPTLTFKLRNYGANEVIVEATGGTHPVTVTGTGDSQSGTLIFTSTDTGVTTGNTDYLVRICLDPSLEHPAYSGAVVCSAVTDMTLSDASYSFSGETMKEQPRGDATCADGFVSWGQRLGCQPDSLVAYAPYDAIDDTTGDPASLGLFTRMTKIIPKTTLAYSGRTSFESCLSTNQAGSPQNTSCNIPYVPRPTSDPWTLSGTFLSGTGTSSDSAYSTSADSTWSGMVSYDTGILATRAGLWRDLGFQINPWNDIWRFPDGTTGVYIDNYGSGDYLKYDLSSLDLGDKFAIEIGVRGAALKRSGEYFLFSLDDGGNIFNNNSLGFELNGGTLEYCTKFLTWASWASCANIVSLSDQNITDSTKLLFQLSKATKTYILYLNEKIVSQGALKYNDEPDTFFPFNNTSHISIGGPNDNYLQWNDIITSLRIIK